MIIYSINIYQVLCAENKAACQGSNGKEALSGPQNFPLKDKRHGTEAVDGVGWGVLSKSTSIAPNYVMGGSWRKQWQTRKAGKRSGA